MTNENDPGRGGGIVTLLRLSLIFFSVLCVVQISRQNAAITMYNSSYYLQGSPVDPDLPTVARSSPRRQTEERDPIPQFVVDPLFKKEQNRIDYEIDDNARCAQYGVEALPEDQKNKRRIFFGSMLADENPEVIMAHAIEVYDKYHVVTLVESNTTHFATPREMNYAEGSMNARALVEGELFGEASKTKVVIDYWMEDIPKLRYMDREVEQRNTIWKNWVSHGMTQGDVGIMADFDEVVSRDFLNAIHVCDFPKLRYIEDERPLCQTPKMILSSMQFEASPLCIKRSEWYHPDVILGNCVLGVGDPAGRVTPARSHYHDGAIDMGARKSEWGSNDYKSYPEDVIDNKRFPLWDGRDIRGVNGSGDPLMKHKNAMEMGHGKTAVYSAAYHFHNWFDDMEVLRNKYATYGHAHPPSRTMKLSNIQNDVDMAVRCGRGLGNKVPQEIGEMPKDKYLYYEENKLLAEGSSGMFSMSGNRPIFFQNRTYVEQRHALLNEIIRTDEAKFGTLYKRDDA